MLFPLYDLNPTQRISWVTYALITANLAIFVWVGTLGPLEQQDVVYNHGFIPVRMAQIQQGKPLVVQIPAEQQFRVRDRVMVVPAKRQIALDPDPPAILLTFISAMFLHGSWLHVLGNMWFLWIYGNNIEDRIGHIPYLLFYLLGGVTATVVHYFTEPNSVLPVIGASGAVAAVLGAYAVTFPAARVRSLLFLGILITVIDVPALVVLGLWFIAQLLEAQQVVPGNLNGGVAWWAHVGGFVAGAALIGVFGMAKLSDEDDDPDAWRNWDGLAPQHKE